MNFHGNKSNELLLIAPFVISNPGDFSSARSSFTSAEMVPRSTLGGGLELSAPCLLMPVLEPAISNYHRAHRHRQNSKQPWEEMQWSCIYPLPIRRTATVPSSYGNRNFRTATLADIRIPYLLFYFCRIDSAHGIKASRPKASKPTNIEKRIMYISFQYTEQQPFRAVTATVTLELQPSRISEFPTWRREDVKTC